ncbi:uncharacterized protein LOC124168434 isoform X2 [Ischnura elegans]|uniref:uncharacterized protein LOC124168434 isoform X2 n=1 Tax=Ischnura elegans TaxID=197161 RepID=UPI001ED8ADE1|nr:uncharacterized protein LOC124168434 isoform X2 [Ischnura elegans]
MDVPPTSRWLQCQETGGDSTNLSWQIQEALELESSFPTCLRMPSVSKVRPKHLSVIALSCFHLSSKQVAHALEKSNDILLSSHQIGAPINIPDPRDLLVISQCRCSLGDLSRMEAIVAEKLSLCSSQGEVARNKPSNGGYGVNQEWPHKVFSSSENMVSNNKTSLASERVHPRDHNVQSSVQNLSHGELQHGSILPTSFPLHSRLPYPVTPMSFLNLIHSFLVSSMKNQTSDSCEWPSRELNDCFVQTSPVRLRHHLEAIACDGSLSCFNPSEIALSLMCVMLDQILGSVTCMSSHPTPYKPGRQAHSSGLMPFVTEIKKLCKITDAGFTRCHAAVLAVVRYYESQCDASRWYGSNCSGNYEDDLNLDEEDEDERSARSWRRNGKRKSCGAYVEGWGPLAWRVSQRTLRNLRPTEKLVSWPPMPTIHESSLSLRIRSCSLSSEESSDPGEEEEEYEEEVQPRSPERGNEWRPLPMAVPLKAAWASMNPLLEEEGGEE